MPDLYTRDMVTNWQNLANAGTLVIELDAITAAVVVEAVQSHARELARKKEFFEAQKSPGSVHGVKLCEAESMLLAELGRTVADGLARVIACDAAHADKLSLFESLKPAKGGRAA